MYSIQNRQKRTWFVPPVHSVVAGAPSTFEAVAIEPGDTVMVKAEHWDAVKVKNDVIEALLTGRHIVVKRAGAAEVVEVEELVNPASPDAPAELTEKDDRVKIDTKTELKEITLNDDTPREGKGRK